MTIYTDANGNIRAIEATDDPDLTPHEVDRQQVFGDMSDFRILCYKYVPQDSGYMVTAAIDYDLIDTLDRAYTQGVAAVAQEVTNLQLAMVEMYEGVVGNG